MIPISVWIELQIKELEAYVNLIEEKKPLIKKNYLQLEKEDIITSEVEVIRVETREDSKRFGCKMKKLSPELNQYIMNKKMSVYMKE